MAPPAAMSTMPPVFAWMTPVPKAMLPVERSMIEPPGVLLLMLDEPRKAIGPALASSTRLDDIAEVRLSPPLVALIPPVPPAIRSSVLSSESLGATLAVTLMLPAVASPIFSVEFVRNAILPISSEPILRLPSSVVESVPRLMLRPAVCGFSQTVAPMPGLIDPP